jgi:PAS domain S-box-containing protein
MDKLSEKFHKLEPSKYALRICMFYFLAGISWVIVTDYINVFNNGEVTREFYFEAGKGVFYVAVTALLFYIFIKKYFSSLQRSLKNYSESEEKYRSLTENIHIGIIRRNASDGICTYVNTKAIDLLGSRLGVLNPVEMLGTKPGETLNDDNVAQKVEKAFWRVVEEHKMQVVELEARGRYINGRMIPEFDDRGRLKSVLSILLDETANRTIIASLRESEHFSRTVLESSKAIIYIFDVKEKKNLYHNKSRYELLGYTREQSEKITSEQALSIIHPDDMKRYLDDGIKKIRALKDGEFFENEFRIKDASGRWRWLKSRETVYCRCEDGSVKEVLGAAYEITESKRIQEELLNKTEYLNLIIESSPMAVFDLDTEGRVVSIWNHSSERIFGWKAEEVIGKPLPIVQPEKHDEFIDNLRRSMSGETILGKEITRIKKSGEPVNISISTFPIRNANGDIERIFAYNEDITIKLRYVEEVKNNTEYLKLLSESGMSTNAAIDSAEIYKISVEYLCRAVKADAVVVSSVMEGGEFIKCEAIEIGSEMYDPSKIPLIPISKTGGEPQSDAIRTGRSRLILNWQEGIGTANTKIFSDIPGKNRSVKQGMKAGPGCGIIIPLKQKDKVIGVLQLQNLKPYSFTEADMRKLEPLAVLLASSMQRAQLYEKLQNEFSEKTRAYEQSRKYYRGIEQSPNSIVITNAAGEIEYVNPYFTELTGYTLEEVIGKNSRLLQSGQTLSSLYKEMWETISGGEVWNGEFLNQKKNGELFWESASIGPITDQSGAVTHFIAIKQDITGKKKQDKELKDSLEEKEIMLKEIHHRVKNNLQVVSSLLNMQVEQYTSPEALEAINSSRNRVKAMALVHENLYRSSKIGKTSMQEYVITLAKNIYSVYGVTFERVTFCCNINNVDFELDTIIPLGLILNEAISNSLKHGFSEGKSGKIEVSINRNNREQEISLNSSSPQPEISEYVLRIADTGKGLPKDFDISKTSSLGMTLITSLSSQLDGNLSIKNDVGTEIKLCFRELKYNSRIN